MPLAACVHASRELAALLRRRQAQGQRQEASGHHGDLQRKGKSRDRRLPYLLTYLLTCKNSENTPTMPSMWSNDLDVLSAEAVAIGDAARRVIFIWAEDGGDTLDFKQLCTKTCSR